MNPNDPTSKSKSDELDAALAALDAAIAQNAAAGHTLRAARGALVAQRAAPAPASTPAPTSGVVRVAGVAERLTIGDAARVARCSERSMRARVADGRIKSTLVDGRRLILACDLEAYLGGNVAEDEQLERQALRSIAGGRQT